MKKLLLIALTILGINLSLTAQNANGHTGPAAPTIDSTSRPVTIETISSKIDTFIRAQSEMNANLEDKINRANRRLQDLQNQSSLRWLMRDMVPILIMIIVGGFIVFIIYLFTSNHYRNNRLRYDTITHLTEMTGSVPEFNRIAIRRAESVPPVGRVHLILSIISGLAATILMMIALSDRNIPAAGVALFFAVISILLFIQYNNLISETRQNNKQ